MRNRIIRGAAFLAILCVMVTLVAVPFASAASYSKVYGRTQDKIRVRESASTNATIIDNIVDDACVYVTSSKMSGDSTFVQIKYRNYDGDVTTGWACQSDGKTTYIKILSLDQANKSFGVKNGDLPSKRVGTFTATERKASVSDSNSTYIKLNSSGSAVKTLQTKLKKLGYYTADETGNAGPKTIAAIKSFQSANGLTADGVAGPSTLAKIDAAYDKLGSSSSSSANSGSGLRLNSSGNDVRDLQDNLTALGYYWATISGNFGPKTETAVKLFQEENGLTPDGIAGKKTLDAIADAVAERGVSSSVSKDNTSVLKLNSKSNRVGQMQKDLKALGFYTADVTNNFGPKTEAAVKAFQTAHKLTADGVAGPKTLDAIDKALSSGSSSGSTSNSSVLKLGTVSDKVADLQSDLTTLGFYYGDITKHFGSLTEQAVKKFQKSRGMTQDGIAGSKTLEAVASAVKGSGSTSALGGGNASSALRKGDTDNPRIGDMQTRLKQLKYYYGDITNDFGPKTEAAVKKFQDDNNLTVDGVAGTKTLNLLYSMTGGSYTQPNTSGIGTAVSTANSYGIITKNNVYLRAKASTTSDAKASLAQNTLVRISETYTTNAGVLWYKISARVGSYTYTGYVRNDMMRTMTADEYKNNGGNADNNFDDHEILGMIKITANKVRLRYSPDTNADIVGEANVGDAFYYVNSVSGWYKTQTGYWISSYYATPMTADEIKNYTGSTSSGSTSTTTTLRNGSTGSAVLDLQNMLKTLGYYDDDLSGHYGNLTEEAVRLFQRDSGLSGDGIAGPKTLAAIRAAYTGSFGTGGTSATIGSTIYNLDWGTYKTKLNNLGLKAGNESCVITDIKTGMSFKVYVQSTGNHADLEPLTAADTATMCSIYGVSHESQIGWERRAVIVTIGNVQVIGSMYGDSHGKDNKPDNNYAGQFCVHLKGSTIHDGDGGNVPVEKNHQAVITQAAADLAAAGKTIATTL